MDETRRSWPVRKVPLGVETANLEASTTAIERLAMMWPLAVEAYTLAGREIPTYSRRDTPAKLFRLGEPRDE